MSRVTSAGEFTVHATMAYPAACTRSTSAASMRCCSCQSVVAPVAASGASGSSRYDESSTPRGRSGRRPPRRADDPVIEGVDRIAGRRGAVVQRVQQRFVEARIQRLELHPYIAVRRSASRASARRGHRLPVGEAVRRGPAFQPAPRCAEPRQDGVVVDHALAVAGGVDVELDTVGAERNRAPEARRGCSRSRGRMPLGGR